MIYKIAASLIVALIFSSVSVAFRNETNKQWLTSIKQSLPLFLSMIVMIAVMMITNYVQHAKITIMIAGATL